MKISVVISTYNGEEYIIEQLDSIKNQIRKPDEVLIFDDCSSDKTCEIIRSYILDNNLRGWSLIQNRTNKGWRRNFIEGIWNASGEIVLPCDQDDIWLENKISIIEEIMQKNESIQLLVSNCIAFYDNGTEIIRPEKEDNKLIKVNIDIDFFETRYPGCTYAIRADLIALSKNYWEEGFPHDALFWRLATYSDSAYAINTSLIHWRRHLDSAYTLESILSKTYSKKRDWLDYAKRALLAMDNYLANYSVKDKEQKMRVIQGNMSWINNRICFYDTPSIENGLKLLNGFKYYPRKRQLLGDWYLVLKNIIQEKQGRA